MFKSTVMLPLPLTPILYFLRSPTLRVPRYTALNVVSPSLIVMCCPRGQASTSDFDLLLVFFAACIAAKRAQIDPYGAVSRATRTVGPSSTNRDRRAAQTTY